MGGGGQLVGGSGEDGGGVREEQAEDLVAGFAWELEEGEGEGHEDWRGWWERLDGEEVVQLTGR